MTQEKRCENGEHTKVWWQEEIKVKEMKNIPATYLQWICEHCKKRSEQGIVIPNVKHYKIEKYINNNI